jgi:hypothetical protein
MITLTEEERAAGYAELGFCEMAAQIDCWVGDKFFPHIDEPGIDLAELLKIGLIAKLNNSEQRAAAAVAHYMQERAGEQAQATCDRAIVIDVMQDRVLLEIAGKQLISADCVLQYLDETLEQKPGAISRLGIQI